MLVKNASIAVTVQVVRQQDVDDNFCWLQIVNKFETTGKQLVSTLFILSDFLQGCSNKADTNMI